MRTRTTTRSTSPFALILLCVGLVAACATPVTPGDGDDAGGDTTTLDTSAPQDTSTADTSMPMDTNPPPPMCGNGLIESGELCDGPALGGMSCQGQGFDGGALSCNATCDGVDTKLCSSSAACGNGIAEADETCDSGDVRGETCELAGFTGGTLGCLSDCSAFDVARCTNCGDGSIDGGEACDGADVGGQTCLALGFDGGAVACSSSCELDTSGCTRDSCGNGTIDAGEDCEGGDLSGASCQSEGFTGGTLSCTSNCAFDLSGCSSCGDGVADPGEACDGNDLGGESCGSQGASAGVLACNATCDGFDTTGCTSCGDGVISGAEACEGSDLDGATCQSQGFDSGTLSCTAACTLDTTGCMVGPSGPGPGALVITEIMVNPDVIADDQGEWFEVHNPSQSTPVDLAGCTLEDNAATHTITGSLIVSPGDYVTLARSASPGFSPDYVYSSLALGNSGDHLRIVCAAGVVDEVVWDGGPSFPDDAGFSMSLGLAWHTSASANDDGLHWCNSPFEPLLSSYDGNNLGTPGDLNYDCEIGYCIVDRPILMSGPATVYGQVFADGRTNLTVNADSDLRLLGQLGYGPLGGDPRNANPAFTWVDATPSSGVDAFDDEYEADLPSSIPVGDYSVFYRFSYDGGDTWRYCDTDGVTSPGGGLSFDPNEAALLEIL